MLYLLDADVPIDANRYYYPVDRVPQFWDWLLTLGQGGQVKFPQEIYDEVTAGNDAAADWLKNNAADLLLNETVSQPMVNQVISTGYAPDLTDDEIEQIGKDLFLIAYAHVQPAHRTVVSNEVSRPSRTRANRHIPDVCEDLGIRAINIFTLIQELNFRARQPRRP